MPSRIIWNRTAFSMRMSWSSGASQNLFSAVLAAARKRKSHPGLFVAFFEPSRGLIPQGKPVDGRFIPYPPRIFRGIEPGAVGSAQRVTERTRRRDTTMVNPFDLKTVFLAKHAQHVVLIHFPIALFITAVAFDYLAQWRKEQTLAAAAYFNLLLAALSTVPVVASGLAAWQWALEGQKLKGIPLMHLILGCTSSVLIWLVFWIHRRSRKIAGRSLPMYRLPIEAV